MQKDMKILLCILSYHQNHIKILDHSKEIMKWRSNLERLTMYYYVPEGDTNK